MEKLTDQVSGNSPLNGQIRKNPGKRRFSFFWNTDIPNLLIDEGVTEIAYKKIDGIAGFLIGEAHVTAVSKPDGKTVVFFENKRIADNPERV